MKRNIPILFFCLLAVSVQAQPQNHEGAPKPPSQEERLKHITERFDKELKLTASQREKLIAAYKNFFGEMEKLRKKEGKQMPPPPPADKKAVDKLVKARDAQIKGSLTAAQYQQYEKLEKTMRPPAPGHRYEPPGNKQL